MTKPTVLRLKKSTDINFLCAQIDQGLDNKVLVVTQEEYNNVLSSSNSERLIARCYMFTVNLFGDMTKVLVPYPCFQLHVEELTKVINGAPLGDFVSLAGL